MQFVTIWKHLIQEEQGPIFLDCFSFCAYLKYRIIKVHLDIDIDNYRSTKSSFIELRNTEEICGNLVKNADAHVPFPKIDSIDGTQDSEILINHLDYFNVWSVAI